MKKKVFVIALLAMCFVGMAQIGKGRMMIGGDFNYHHSNNEQLDPTGLSSNDTKNSSFTPSLRFGRFFSDHWMFGLFGSYNANKYENASISYIPLNNYFYKSTIQAQSFNAGLFSRYYHMIGESNFAWYAQVSAGYGMGSSKSKTTSSSPLSSGPINTHAESTNMNLFANPGIVYFLNKHVAIEASFGSIGYSLSNSKNYDNENKATSENKTAGFNSGLNFSLSSLFLGINFYFGGKSQEPAKG